MTLLLTPAPAIEEAAAQAQHELFAARYENAAARYSTLLEQNPTETDAWYGLVRAQLGLKNSKDAYAAAEQALRQAPDSAGAQTAAGLAMYRRGELAKAEEHFRKALQLSPDYAGALRGLATVYSTISMFKSARELRLKAYKLSSDDPDLMLAYANTLKSKEHIRALEAALERLDPGTEEARRVRVHIANDRAVGDRKLRRLVSSYQTTHLKLVRLLDGPNRQRGVGLSVRFNQQTMRLLLDTGASGISVSPKLAQKAGLQVISGETSEAKGIGDQKAESELAYLASEVSIGDVVFADYPVSVFRSAQSSDFDGLIGADVFARYLVKVDFVQMAMTLEARPDDAGKDDEEEEPRDWNAPPPPGFSRLFRFGDHLAVPTLINNGGHTTLFLIDSGSTSNLIDTETAKQFTKVRDDSRTVVNGIQGKVRQISSADRISLVFAGFRYDNTDVVAISLARMGDDMGVAFGGILGMPVLGQLAVTIDYRAGAVKFEYHKH